MNPPENPSPTARKKIRWWPAALVLCLAAFALIIVWLVQDLHRQERYLRTAMISFWTLALLTAWFVLFSRLAFRIRRGALLLLLLLAGGFASAFHIRGVTGDLLPIMEFRWKKRSDAILPAKETIQPRQAVPESKTFTADFPQFLGPNRNAVLEQPTLLRDWEKNPPQEIWRHPVGAGWSGYSIQGNYAITMEQHGEEETVVCNDLASGKLIWAHADPVKYATIIAGEGPRSAPTISGNVVVTYGATGMLNCLELSTGKVIWSRNVLQENKGHLPDWGVSCSPLILDDKVIVTSAGPKDNLFAYSLSKGELVWSGGGFGADYSSPVFGEIAGQKQILIFNPGGVSSHHPANGGLLWHYPWPGGHPHIALPLILEHQRVLISTGYGTGCELISIAASPEGKLKPSRVWKSMNLKSKFSPLVTLDGFIYGLDDGIFTCLDLATGERKWKDGRLGHSQFLLVQNLILLMAEKGSVILIEPNPSALKELGSFKVFSDKTWNPPALAGEYLVVRNDQEAACFKLAIQKPAKAAAFSP